MSSNSPSVQSVRFSMWIWNDYLLPSILLGQNNPNKTLAALGLLNAVLYVSFIMNPAAVEVFAYLWAVCGFGIVAYLQSFFFRQAFRKLSPELLTKKKSAQAEGAIFTDEEHREEDLMVQESSFSDPDWNRRDDLFPEEKPKKNPKRGRR